MVGSFCAYSWYWYIRSIIFYFRNGFDFSQDFGPEMYRSDLGGDDDCVLETPRQKFLIGLPFFVVLTTFMLLPIILALMGILKPCVDCGP